MLTERVVPPPLSRELRRYSVTEPAELTAPWLGREFNPIILREGSPPQEGFVFQLFGQCAVSQFDGRAVSFPMQMQQMQGTRTADTVPHHCAASVDVAVGVTHDLRLGVMDGRADLGPALGRQAACNAPHLGAVACIGS
jgi:hypothetical protein